MTALVLTIEQKFDNYVAFTTHQPTENKHTTNGERNVAKLLKTILEMAVSPKGAKEQEELNMLFTCAYRASPEEFEKIIEKVTGKGGE